MLNELIQLFTTNTVQSSELMYNATLQLHEFLDEDIIIRCFTKISENLGDQLPNLRKASHQLFQAYIRMNKSFDPILDAMLRCGFVHNNWSVRQKNANSLQSLILSEGKYFQEKSLYFNSIIEMLLGRLQDSNIIVCKATEQTLISMITLPNFKEGYKSLSLRIQTDIDEFVTQMKQQNQIKTDFGLKDKSLNNDQNNSLPFENLSDLQDTQWQMRYEAIQNINNTISQVQLQSQEVEQLFEHIIPLINDHNFNIVLTSIQIIQKCLQFYQVKSLKIREIYNKLGDSKSAVRAGIKQVLLTYLQKTRDNELLILILQQDNKNSAYKDELLELISELSSRNKMLLQENLELVIKELTPFIQHPKLKQKTYETLTLVGQLNTQLSRRILNSLGLKEEFHDLQHVDVSTASSNISELPVFGRNTKGIQQSQYSDQTQTAQSTLNKSGQQSMNQSIQSSLSTNTQNGYVPSCVSQQPQKRTKEQQYAQSSSVEFREIETRASEGPKTQFSKPFRVVKNPQADQIDQDTNMTYSKPFQRKQKMEGDKTFQPIYLEEVNPLEDPEIVLKTLLNDLRYDEWSKQFEALNSLRRLAKHNKDQLKKHQHFQQILIEMTKQIESLRSGVSKNALIALQELSNIYGNGLDCILDQALQRLIKKAIDLNTFISEEVKKATVAILTNCNEQKCVTLASQVYQSKSTWVKVNLCTAFNQLIKRVDSNSNAFEKIVTFLCTYVTDQAQEVRQIAKEGLIQLDSRKLQTIIGTMQDSKRILTILYNDMTATQELRKLNETRTPEQRNRTPNTKKASVEFEQIPNQLQIIEVSKDWRQKQEALDWLCSLAKKESQAMNGHRYCTKFLDVLCKLINDGNTKIALHACEEFIALVSDLKQSLQANHINIINAVSQATASNNNSVRQAAELLFIELFSQIDLQFVVPQVCHVVLFGPSKSKATAINMLANHFQDIYAIKPQLIGKHLVPLAKKLQDEQKPDIKLASQKLFQMLVSTCPSDVAHLKLLK